MHEQLRSLFKTASTEAADNQTDLLDYDLDAPINTIGVVTITTLDGRAHTGLVIEAHAPSVEILPLRNDANQPRTYDWKIDGYPTFIPYEHITSCTYAS